MAITPRTKAIIATHLYGNLCEMDKLLEIGEKHNIAIIEDAAEAIGSVYKGKRADSMGKFSTFSFYGTKTLTSGEGGMFLISDETLYEKVLTLSNRGRARSQKKQFWVDMPGYKLKMPNIQAAIGCAQLKRVDELISRKRDILNFYRSNLEDMPEIKMNHESPGTTICAWMPNIVFEKTTAETRDTLLKTFKDKEIDARVFFGPLSSLPMFEEIANDVAYDIPNRSINLPSYHDMAEADLEEIISKIRNLRPNR